MCAKASGTDPFKKPVAARKRKAPEERQKTTNLEFNEFPSLASMCIKVFHYYSISHPQCIANQWCIQIISEHIDDVEALGDISWAKKTEIGRVLAKNRSLCVLVN